MQQIFQPLAVLLRLAFGFSVKASAASPPSIHYFRNNFFKNNYLSSRIKADNS
jgi:hypothetical protein